MSKDDFTAHASGVLLERIAALEEENSKLREDAKGWMDAAFLSDNEAYSTVPLETLKEENERLRKALEPFAKEALWWEGYRGDEPVVEGFPGYEGVISVADLREARAALEAKP